MTKRSKNYSIKSAVAGLLLVITPALVPDTFAGQAPVNLGSAARFGILAGSGITSVPTSSVKGDVGLSPAARSNITGLTAAEVTGSIYAADDGGATAAMLTQAKGDLGTAFIDASPAGRPGGVDVASLGGAAGELGGRTLAPGLYKSAPGSYDITSLDLTLDAGGDPNAVWIFQAATTVNISTDRKVTLSGGAQAGNIFWQVGTSATLSPRSAFKGTIMAAQSISIQTGALLDGRALAQSAAVTLDSNPISVPVLLSAPLTFGPINRAIDGFVTLVITNTPGRAFTLQTSANLTDWTLLANRTATGTPDNYTDITAVTEPKRFYRAFYP